MTLKSNNVVLDKSFAFSIRIVNMYKHLTSAADNKEFILSKQVLRSGTSIGANIRESRRAQSPKDFVNKLYIALKEADETSYWLELLNKTGYLPDDVFESIFLDCEELVKLLTTIIKTTQKKYGEVDE